MTGTEIIAECKVIFGQRGVGEIGNENWLKWINSGILYMSTALCVYECLEDEFVVTEEETEIDLSVLPADAQFVSFTDPWGNEGAIYSFFDREPLVRIRPQDLSYQLLSGHTSHKVYFTRGNTLYIFPAISADKRYVMSYYGKAPKLVNETYSPVFDNEAYHFALVDFALSRAFASKVTEGTRMDSAKFHYDKFYQQVVDIKTGKSSKPLTGVEEGK